MGRGLSVSLLPWSKREEADEQVEKRLNAGGIEPSGSPWMSPVVLVKKKDGTTRFCVDHRQLSNVTLKDFYPLPRINDTLDAISGSNGSQLWTSRVGIGRWRWITGDGYWQAGEPERWVAKR